ncbi:YfcC family protein [Bacillus mojavensis]|uniref:YfcC family protein n=1 Tax=Bacillus mojavensis TaxID=72360 RepID=UPI002DBC1744|nr:YfcC family protein [Bacillus mojavensis]MEC1289203.1 YfcC family protein [Bacillus mojavensis]MEC1635217.1 YfcC family protein [Bacillus mojavensis]MEC1705517.1 YfcC family protein [Bacillus mojavensis]MEC5245433.1 YfcC family protein [Bacillus mojavensis]
MSMPAAETQPKKKRTAFNMPDAYVLLFIIAFICAVASYIVPAGEFDRVTKGEVTTAVPGSYHSIEQSPVSLISFFTSLQDGMVGSAPIIFLILFTGGTIAILEKTGAINGLIYNVISKFRTKQLLFICIVGALFSVLGTTGIVVNSVIGFIPIGLIVARSLKWDAVAGAAVIYIGCYAGFNSTILSPSPLGLSQSIAELPLFSGIGLRVVIYLCFLLSSIIYIYWYTRKLKKSKDASVLGTNWFPAAGLSDANQEDKSVPFTVRHKLILGVAGLSLIGFLYGALKLGWSDSQMAATFIFISVLAGFIGGLAANDIAKTFITGCQSLVYGALIVGMARSISVILENGKLLDTVVNALASVLDGFSPMAGAIGMYIASALLHFLISSGSGEAVVFIPILAPLADLMGITRQVAVEAVMLGEGVVNCVNPTSGVLMAVLAASGIPYVKWLRFMLPLALIWFLIGLVFICIGVLINWGPY